MTARTATLFDSPPDRSHPVTDHPDTSSLDVAGDSVEQFLIDLRQLRDRQPSLSYQAMSDRAKQRGRELSRSAMHTVYGSRKLPTRDAVSAFVVALTDTATAEEFDTRWVELNGGDPSVADKVDGSRSTVPPDAPEVDDAQDQEPEPDSTRTRRVWWWMVAMLVVVASNIITCLVTIAVVRPSTTDNAANAPKSAAAPTAEPVRNGMNPNQLPRCLDDVQTVDSATNEAFTVKVNFSEHCNAAWGKVERIDGRGLGNTIGIRIYPAATPAGNTTAQRTSERDATAAFTPILVRTDPTERLCVDGTVTDGARTIPAARPVCL